MRVNEQKWSDTALLIAGATALLILVGGFGTWATITTLEGAVVAPGKFEVEDSGQVVQHRDGGIIDEILVREGDRVEKGQVLIRLDDTELASTLAITESQLFEIEARVGRLEAERDGAAQITFPAALTEAVASRPGVAEVMIGQKRLFEARRQSLTTALSQLEKQKGQIADEIEGLRAQQASQRDQMVFVSEDLGAKAALQAQGLARASEVLALRRELTRLRGELGELVAAEAQDRGRMTELDIRALTLRDNRREEAIGDLRDFSHQRIELTEKRISLMAQLSRLDITAPVSGIVHGLQVHAVRGVIRAADPVLSVIPQDGPLVILADLATTDVDEVFPGQQVSLRLSALDRLTPELAGRVTRISADTFEDEQSGRSHFRVELTLMPGETEKLPAGTVLVPGMPVESFIRTGDKSPLAYLVEPLTQYFSRALRES